MGTKIITEAERRATPRPAAPVGVCFTAPKGQKISLERGVARRSASVMILFAMAKLRCVVKNNPTLGHKLGQVF